MEILIDVCPMTETEPGYRKAQNEQLQAILRILRADFDCDRGSQQQNADIIEADSATIGLLERGRSE